MAVEEKLKTIIGKWKIKADNDFYTAEFGLTADKPITDTICFHCQQAVEKYLKLFLISKGISPEKSHSIPVLLQKCISMDNSFSELEGIESLNDYSVSLRYPDDFYMPSLEETEKAVEKAGRVREFVLIRTK